MLELYGARLRTKSIEIGSECLPPEPIESSPQDSSAVEGGTRSADNESCADWGDASCELDEGSGQASGESAADVLMAGDATDVATVEDDGTREDDVVTESCLLPLARGGILAGTCRGARSVACWAWKLKKGGVSASRNTSMGEDIAREDVAVVEDEPCSNSESGRGLGVVIGVEASDRGGEGPSGPCCMACMAA